MDKEHPVPEILPLKKQELAIITNNPATHSPQLHYHPEHEIIFINTGGFKRTIGNTIQPGPGSELFLIGPNLQHKFEPAAPNDKTDVIISIHFSNKFLNELGIKKRRKLNLILEDSAQGILFSPDTVLLLKERIANLINLKKKAALAELTEILSIMAEAENYRLLSKVVRNARTEIPDTTMAGLDAYLRKNYRKKITLEEVCQYTGKSSTSFNRFIKKNTGITFTNYLNYIRAGFAARRLIETTDTVANVAAGSGFNNLAHFNRVFKASYGMTPLQYRHAFYGRRRFI